MSMVDTKGFTTLQQIIELENAKRLQREKLTLFKKPVETLFIFTLAAYSYIKLLLKYLLLHPVMLYFLVPVIVVWLLSEQFQGPYTHFINQVEFYIKFTIWWIGLGILSSIGFGSGLQTGMLFLFPHILRVSLAAATCKTLDFDSDSNMWFSSPKNLFQCPVLTKESTPVTFWGVWLKIIHVCFLQAAGTAIGEIPPYWITRASRLAAKEAGSNESEAEMPDELNTTNDSTHFQWYNKLKQGMIHIINHYGFYGVLLMASFPNIAFDICGVYCGHYLMPFWTFFGATFVGKAIIRNGYQSVVYVALCSEKYLEILIQLLQQLTPDSLQCDKIIREVLEESRSSFHKQVTDSMNAADVGSKRSGGSGGSSSSSKSSSSVANQVFFCWQMFMAFILLSFFLSCVAHFAQYHQLTLDNEEIRKLKKQLGIFSPVNSPLQPLHSGRNTKDTMLRHYGYSTSIASNSTTGHLTHSGSANVIHVSHLPTEGGALSTNSSNSTGINSSSQSYVALNLSADAQPKKSSIAAGAEKIDASNKRE